MHLVEAWFRLRATSDSRHGSEEPIEALYMTEVVQRFDAIRAALNKRELRSRVVDKGESAYHSIIRRASLDLTSRVHPKYVVSRLYPHLHEVWKATSFLWCVTTFVILVFLLT